MIFIRKEYVVVNTETQVIREVPRALIAVVLDLMQAGKELTAIKAVRLYYPDMGLADAKVFVEALAG